MPQLFAEIENDARSGGGLFDIYWTNPVILGAAATLGAFVDMTPYIKASSYADWTDVLLALRTHVTSFEDKTYIILLDGDTHTLFYRKDILEEFGVDPPRTWNEYIAIAQRFHGTVYNNQTLSGSCVSRRQGDHAMYWSHLVLSTLTQTEGTSQGSLFDTRTMDPLLGPAGAEMLRIHEELAAVGTPDEFFDEVNPVQNGNMNDGSCVLTFMWGDMFRRSNAEGSVVHTKLGIAPTPGSEVVWNRQTQRMEPCTRTLCPYAKYYNDIGFVNQAPYAANGGWGGAISANTSPEKQAALADFLLWSSSREQSDQYVIPNSTLPWYEINGQDPWRKSHLDVDKWAAQGYDRELSKQYVESILSNLVSKNVVVEARFPKAGEIMSVLDKEVYDYLWAAHTNAIAVEDRPKARLNAAQRIEDQWRQIIKEYDQRGDTVAPILEIYQRLRGVYYPIVENHYLTKVRPIGLSLMALIYASALGCIAWVIVRRETKVVRASQPIFLVLICFGTMVLGSAIFPMGIDDGIASQKTCNAACMATTWLVAIGFSISFAALFSKIWRLNILMTNAIQCRKIQVTVKDVLYPMVFLIVLNVVFLTVWTSADPLEWERIDIGRTQGGELESYGKCSSEGRASKVCLIVLGVINFLAVFLANVQVIQTSNSTVAYSESKYVGLSMASILQAFLIGCPLLFLADTNPVARYVVRTLLIFVLCMSMLGFIFIPKIYVNTDNTVRESSKRYEANHNDFNSTPLTNQYGMRLSMRTNPQQPNPLRASDSWAGMTTTNGSGMASTQFPSTVSEIRDAAANRASIASVTECTEKEEKEEKEKEEQPEQADEVSAPEQSPSVDESEEANSGMFFQ